MEFGQKIGSLWQDFRSGVGCFIRGYSEEEVALNRLILSGHASPEILEGFRRFELHNLSLRMALLPRHDLFNLSAGTEYPLIIKMKRERDALRGMDGNVEQILQDRARRNLQMWGKL